MDGWWSTLCIADWNSQGMTDSVCASTQTYCYTTIMHRPSQSVWYNSSAVILESPPIHGFGFDTKAVAAVDRYYTALFSTLKQTHCGLVACDYRRAAVAFYSAFWSSTRIVYLQHCLVVTWLVPHETAAILAHSVYAIQLCIMSHHFAQSHICRVYACLAVTCHLHFQQNDQDPLLAPVVTQGWNGYWNKSRHRKLTTEKKILPPLRLGLKPTTFWSQVQCSETHTELSQPAMQQGTNPEVVTISREVHLDDEAGDAFAVAGAGQRGAVTQVVHIHAAVFGPHR